MAELGTTGSGGENPDPAMSRPEDPGDGGLENTGGAGQDAGRSGASAASGSRESDSKPGPAETLTRERYADEMHDGPSMGHDGSREYDRDAEREPEEARADISAGADGQLAEPRSRQEVADEARSDTETFGSGAEPVRERADGHDHLDHWFSVVPAERTVGDTTPTGIGLKLASSPLEQGMVYVDGREVEATHNPADGIWFQGMGEIPDAPLGDPYGTGRAGEVVANPDDVKLSRLERFSDVVCERLDDIVDQIDHNAEIVQDLHLKDPPQPPSPTFKGTADRSPQISPVTVDHGLDFGHGLDAALVIGAVGVKMGNWVHEKWQQRMRDRHHGGN